LGVGEQEGEQRIKVALVPVQNSTVFPMRFSLAAEEEEEEADAAAPSDADYMTKRKLLADGFGSRKRQRIIRSNMANRVDLKDDERSLAVLDHALEGVQQAATASPAAPEIVRSALPPHNTTTENVAEIYPLETVAEAEVWDSLEDGGKAIVAMCKKSAQLQEGRDSGRHARVVLSAVQPLKSVEKLERRQRAKCWVLLQHMLTFFNLHKNKKGESLAKMQHVPDAVKAYLLESFTMAEPKDGVVKNDAHPLKMEIKLKCYMCVMVLVGSGGAVEKEGLEAFAADLKMTLSALLQFFREVSSARA
jgi:hypothetical protein